MTETTSDGGDPIPVEKSFTWQNGFHLDCNKVDQSPSYFLCLHKIENWKRCAGKELLVVYPKCFAAMDANDCPAMKMRAEEIAQNRSIYFAQRAPIPPVQEDRLLRPRKTFSVWPAKHDKGDSSSAVVSRSTPEKLIEQPVALDFAQVVNTIVQNEKSAEKQTSDEPKEPEQKFQPLQGESLLAMAKRLASKNDSKG